MVSNSLERFCALWPLKVQISHVKALKCDNDVRYHFTCSAIASLEWRSAYSRRLQTHTTMTSLRRFGG